MIMKHIFSLLVACSLMSTGVLSQEAKDPIAELKSQLKDPTKPFTTLVEFSIKPESIKEWRKLVQESVKNSRQEPGCITYTSHQDVKDAGKFVFVEVWRDVAALEFHVQQPYVKALLGKAGEISSAPPVIRVLTPWVPAPPKPKDKTEVKPASKPSAEAAPAKPEVRKAE
jgi:quinol monooxygenase YgiN